MKKNFKYYVLGWAVLFALFNVIAFLFGGVDNEVKYTSSFWIGYVFITVCFFGQIVVSFFALNQDNAKKMFYNISVFTTSYSGLIASFIFGGLCMIIPVLPYWVGAILCAIVLTVNMIAMLKAKAATDIVTDLDSKIKAQTLFIKALTVEAESLISRAKSEDVKAECQKVYEAIRYSDPMSSDALSSMESQITIAFHKFSEAVSADQIDAVKETTNEVIVLVDDRNKKCKLLK